MKKIEFFKEEGLEFLSKEELRNLGNLLTERFQIFLEEESFDLEMRALEDCLQIRVCLSKNNELMKYPVECVSFYKDHAYESTVDEEARLSNLATSGMDCILYYFEEYFRENRDLFLPLNWTSYEQENSDISVVLRGFVRQSKLENEADAFLERHGHGEHMISPISGEL